MTEQRKEGTREIDSTYPYPMKLYCSFLRVLTIQNPLEFLSTSRFRGKTLFLHVKCNFPVKKIALNALKVDKITCSSKSKGLTIIASRIVLYSRKIDCEIENSDLVISVEFSPLEFSQMNEVFVIKLHYEAFGNRFSLSTEIRKNVTAITRILNGYRREYFPKNYPNFFSVTREMLTIKNFRRKCQKRFKERRRRDQEYLSFYQRLRRNRFYVLSGGRQVIHYSEDFEKFDFKFPFHFEEEQKETKLLESSINIFIFLSGITKSDNQTHHVMKSGMFCKLKEYRKKIRSNPQFFANLHHVLNTPTRTNRRRGRTSKSKQKNNFRKRFQVLLDHVLMVVFGRIHSLDGMNNLEDLVSEHSMLILDILKSSFYRIYVHMNQRKKRTGNQFDDSYSSEELKLDETNIKIGEGLINRYQVLREIFFSHPIRVYLFKRLKSNLISIFRQQQQEKEFEGINYNIFKRMIFSEDIKLRLIKNTLLLISSVILKEGAIWKSRMKLCQDIFLLFSKSKRMNRIMRKTSVKKVKLNEVLIINLLSFPSKELIFKIIKLISFGLGFNKFYQFLKKKKKKRRRRRSRMINNFHHYFEEEEDEDEENMKMIRSCKILDHHFFSQGMVFKLFTVLRVYNSSKSNETYFSRSVISILLSLMDPFIYHDIFLPTNRKRKKLVFPVSPPPIRRKSPKKKIKKKKKKKKISSSSSSSTSSSEEVEEEEEEEEENKFDLLLRIVGFIAQNGSKYDQALCVSHFLYLFQFRKPVEEVISRMKHLLDHMNEKGILESYTLVSKRVIDKSTFEINSFDTFIKTFFLMKDKKYENEEEEEEKLWKVIKTTVQYFSPSNFMMVTSQMIFPNWWICTDPKYDKNITSSIELQLSKLDDVYVRYWRNYFKNSRKMIQIQLLSDDYSILLDFDDVDDGDVNDFDNIEKEEMINVLVNREVLQMLGFFEDSTYDNINTSARKKYSFF